MIIGPVLGGCMCAAYFLEGATVEEAVVSAAPTAQPGGAWRRRGTGVETPSRSTPRFKGSRQVFEDGVFRDVEEVEAPPTPEPTVAEVVEAITAPPKPTKRGAEVVAGALPALPVPPVLLPPREPDLGARARKRKRDIAQFNAAVLARILPELTEW